MLPTHYFYEVSTWTYLKQSIKNNQSITRFNLNWLTLERK